MNSQLLASCPCLKKDTAITIEIITLIFQSCLQSGMLWGALLARTSEALFKSNFGRTLFQGVTTLALNNRSFVALRFCERSELLLIHNEKED